MPGAVPRTSTQALNIATIPYILKLASSGAQNQNLQGGLNIQSGEIVHAEVKEALTTV